MTDDIKLPPLPESLLDVETEARTYARAAVEADRQGRMPSDEEALQLAAECCDSTDATGEEPRFTTDESILRFARALLSRYGSGQPAAIGKPVGYVLIEDGKAVAFFDEIPPGHYRASAFVPVGVIGQPAASAEPVGYLIRGKASHDEYIEDQRHAQRRKEQRMDAFSGEDETEIIPLYAAPVAAQAQPQQAENQEALADTQRAIIEAAERRGYERGLADCGQDREDGK